MGSLPNLEHFEFIGTSSCPPVATALTSLIWEVDSNTKMSILPENAELAWIEMKPKLEKLREFRFISTSGYETPNRILTIAFDIIRGAAKSLTSLTLWPYILDDDTPSMDEAFPNLKRLEVAKQYVLGAPHLVKARTTGGHDFDVDLEELEKSNEEEKWMRTADVQYLGPLSAKVLRFDERYRYSRDEMEVIGALWKNSVQGKKSMMKMRRKLAVYHFG